MKITQHTIVAKRKDNPEIWDKLQEFESWGWIRWNGQHFIWTGKQPHGVTRGFTPEMYAEELLKK